MPTLQSVQLLLMTVLLKNYVEVSIFYLNFYSWYGHLFRFRSLAKIIISIYSTKIILLVNNYV